MVVHASLFDEDKDNFMFVVVHQAIVAEPVRGAKLECGTFYVLTNYMCFI